MIRLHSLVVYKNHLALVKESAADKVHIELMNGETVKVREKDFEMIHPGPVTDIKSLEEMIISPDIPGGPSAAVREVWDLLVDEGESLSLQELADLLFGGFTPSAAWAVYKLLVDGLYFTGTIAAIFPRKREEVEAEEKKRLEKQREAGDREEFLEYLRKSLKIKGEGRSKRAIAQKSPAGISAENAGAEPGPSPESAAYARFFQDVEALALGKSSKSKTMKELGLSETAEDAHALLLQSGFWTTHNNPHPPRFGLSLTSAKSAIDPPPDEERRDLTQLQAFAIDNDWSKDPDDAVSIEECGGKTILYVHVADPASSIGADSPVEREARDRGATLYLPDGNFTMLAGQALSFFALGFQEKSPALTFKVSIDENGEIDDIDIFPSLVKVKSLNYKEADELAEVDSSLRSLHKLAERNMYRRSSAGAVNIDLPETHIYLDQGHINIEPVVSYRYASVVRECMLLAGEGAAIWSAGRQFNLDGTMEPLAFPFVSQEAGDLPEIVLPGMAGSYRLRRSMQSRTLSLKPGVHWGLGLDFYSQVTSPLRRYTDLLAHIQIRSFLRGDKPLSADELTMRMGAGEAASAAVSQAERASRSHWTMAYLSDKKDSIWDAVALEKKGNRWALIIPALALEVQVSLRKDPAPNDTVKLVLKSVNIPKGEALFAHNEG